MKGPWRSAQDLLASDFRRHLVHIVAALDAGRNAARDDEAGAVEEQRLGRAGGVFHRVYGAGGLAFAHSLAEAAGESETSEPGYGIENMRHRAAQLDGRLEVKRGSEGTTVELWFPLSSEKQSKNIESAMTPRHSHER